MSRRAAPGDRAAIEAVLRHDPVLFDGFERLRWWLNIGDAWDATGAGALYETVAVVMLASRLVQQRGFTVRQALYHACGRLGLEPETTRSRSQRWSERSRAECVHHAHHDPQNSLYRLIQEVAEQPLPDQGE